MIAVDTAPTQVQLAKPFIIATTPEEAEQLLNGISHTVEKDCKEITIRAGRTPTGALVVVIDSHLSGECFVINATHNDKPCT